METEGTNLPWELIIEIFSRLPVKSLIRFRSVSKPCNSLVTEPHFINKHLYHSTQDTTQNLKKVILSHTKPHHKHLVSCPLSSLSHKPPIEDAMMLVYPLKDKSSSVTVWDSCDGLFCIKIYYGDDEEGLFLWNPSIKESTRLPNLTIEVPHGFERYEKLANYTYALGSDSLNNDYKVLRVTEFDNYRETKIVANMYSLNTNSWRKLEEFPQYNFLVTSYCGYLNGAFHWSAIKSTNKIISLNLSTERFGEVPLPNYTIMQNPDEWVEFSLAVLRGMLCVYCNRIEHSFVLWVMKDYGHQESWEKIFEIPNDIFDVPSLYLGFAPMYLYEDGQILLLADRSKGSALVIYNKNRYGFKKVVARGLNRIQVGYIYLESLISPLAQRHL